MPTSFGDVYAKLCERYPDPRERGRQFEPLMEKVRRCRDLQAAACARLRGTRDGAVHGLTFWGAGLHPPATGRRTPLPDSG